MFATKPKLFSIGTITVFTSVLSYQLVKLTTLVGLNLVEHVFVLIVSFDISIELVCVLLVKIVIPPNFQVTFTKDFLLT
jgi:hypothetical protein